MPCPTARDTTEVFIEEILTGRKKDCSLCVARKRLGMKFLHQSPVKITQEDVRKGASCF
jgi:hypothetical protein